jgi:hypothetical protein
MTATVAGIHLGLDTHANRPAANTLPDGSLYSCSTHGLIYKSNYAGNSWATWATLGGTGLADQGIFTYLDGTVAAAPATPAAGKLRLYAKTGKVLAVKDDAGVETVLGAASGGSSYPPLDQYTVDATYGDHFTAASLGGIWTRRGFVLAAETYQVGKNGTYMRAASNGVVVGSGWLQSAAVDGTWAMKYIPRFFGTSPVSLGVALVDSSGTGVVISAYNNPVGILVQTLTGYNNYGGSFHGVGGDTNQVWWDVRIVQERPIWLYLRKSGTSVFGSYSLDGEVWAPESAAVTWAGTQDRAGMLMSPLGGWVSGSNDPGYVDIDWFNKIA